MQTSVCEYHQIKSFASTVSNGAVNADTLLRERKVSFLILFDLKNQVTVVNGESLSSLAESTSQLQGFLDVTSDQNDSTSIMALRQMPEPIEGFLMRADEVIRMTYVSVD